MTRNKKQEMLAKFFHENTWSHWMKYMLSVSFNWHVGEGNDKYKTINAEHQVLAIHIKNWKRWKRQMETNYEDLSEKEKDSDRNITNQFRKYLKDNDYMIISKEEYNQLKETQEKKNYD